MKVLATVLLFLFCFPHSRNAVACHLFGASGDVTADSITMIAKTRDTSNLDRRKQRVWYSPRMAYEEGEVIEFRDITIDQTDTTYKFIATNSYVEDQTAGYGINEYGVVIVSHDLKSWDDDNLGAEYFHDQDYVALVLARCKNASQAIDLFDDLILPHGINAESYLIADLAGLWLMETTGFNYVAKPIADDVVSSKENKYTIRTDWNDPGNRYNADILINAHAHGCDTTSLDFAECFGSLSPGSCDSVLLALKDRGNIVVQDMRVLLRDRAIDNKTGSACVIPVRPDKDARYFSMMWDSRANPKYGNVFLPFWMAIADTALPGHYTSWPAGDPDCAWNLFSEIVNDPALRSIAEPIWQALQAELDDEFDPVETNMQTYLDSSDLLSLQEYIDSYVYEELDDAYDLAADIIDGDLVPERIADLTVTLSGENLVLQWSPVTVDTNGYPLEMDRYLICRDTVAHFDPGSVPTDSTVNAIYEDTSGVVGDIERHHYYVVKAVSRGKESAASGEVGEFDRGLTNEEK